MSKSTGFVFAAVMVFVATAFAAPYTGYYYPSSIQAGTKIRVLIGGQAHGGVNHGIVTGDGVRITKVTHLPNYPRAPGKTQTAWVFDWLYDIIGGKRVHQDLPPEAVAADTDWARNDVWENLDEHDDLELQTVARFIYTPENYPQPTPSLDNLLILDIEADANAKPGRREIMIYDGRSVSAPHPFYVTSEPHAVEPFFVIPPIEKRKAGLGTVLHYPNNIPVQSLPVCLDGQIWPGETDVFKLRLKKGKRLTCVLNAREMLPYLGDAVPGFFNPVLRLSDSKGKEIAFVDDFYFLPDPILSCIVPEDGVYNLEIHDNLYRGRSDFVYMVRCYEDSLKGHSYTPQQRAFECYPIPGAHKPPQAGEGVSLFNGVIDCPGRVARHDFKVTEPKALSFELFARRHGSPIDGVLKLYGPLKGATSLSVAPMLACWDDVDKFLSGSVPQAICDPRGAWNFLEPGDYCVTVSDRVGDGGEDFSYTLCISDLEPEFEVYTDQSAFVLHNSSVSFTAKIVRRNGFTGPIEFDDIDGFSCHTYCDPNNPNVAEVTISPEKCDWKGAKCVNFTASAEIAPGKFKKVHVTPGDPVEQAFAYSHLLPAHGFYFIVP